MTRKLNTAVLRHTQPAGRSKRELRAALEEAARQRTDFGSLLRDWYQCLSSTLTDDEIQAVDGVWATMPQTASFRDAFFEWYDGLPESP